MRFKKFLTITAFVIFSLLACKKEDRIDPYFAEVYPQILEEIDINCEEGISDHFISVKINGVEFCRYEDISKYDFRLWVSNKFTTTSPSINTGDVPSNSRKGMSLKLGDSSINREEYFNIQFPDFELDRNVYEYLDSLTNIEYHDIIGAEDIIIPDGLSLVEEGLLKSSGGYLNKFHVELSSKDYKTETLGSVFSITSIFGAQKDSFLRFRKVKKTKEIDGIYYYFEIEYECNIYHWAQYGYEGLWGELRDGIIEVKVKVEE